MEEEKNEEKEIDDVYYVWLLEEKAIIDQKKIELQIQEKEVNAKMQEIENKRKNSSFC